MSKVLIAVDDTKTSKAVLYTFQNLVRQPESIVLLHVQRIAGRSMMIEMLGEAEMSTLKDALKGTEHKEALDRKAESILDSYREELEQNGAVGLRTVVRAGHPAEEILKVADEEGVDLILLGYSGRRGLSRLIAGSVAKDVEKHAKVPVLVARRPLMCEEPYSWRDAYQAISVSMVILLGMLLLRAIL